MAGRTHLVRISVFCCFVNGPFNMCFDDQNLFHPFVIRLSTSFCVLLFIVIFYPKCIVCSTLFYFLVLYISIISNIFAIALFIFNSDFLPSSFRSSLLNFFLIICHYYYIITSKYTQCHFSSVFPTAYSLQRVLGPRKMVRMLHVRIFIILRLSCDNENQPRDLITT